MITRILLRRLGSLPIVLLGVSVLVFLSLRLIPGDPALAIAGIETSQAQLQAIREELGLTAPPHVQFFRWLSGIVRGDWGKSFTTGRPVLPTIAERFFLTLQLSITSLIFATVIGVSAGLIASAYRNSAVDYVMTSAALVGGSFPSFWLAIVLILVFSSLMRWLPAGGHGSVRHLILPTVSLGLFSVGIVARMTRASMLEVLGQDYIRTARAKGLSERVVIASHALRNALIPILTVITLQFGYLLSGAAVTETVFRWPGIGRLLVLAILRRDFPLVQGGVLVIAVSFVVMNLIADLLYIVVNPRVRL